MQDSLGVEVTSLIEDPASVTISSIAKEAWQRIKSSPSGSASLAQSSSSAEAAASQSWIARAPVQIKMRLFCLPYAGGVSENVFGR